jgi:ATP-dependent DNA helicase RecG
MSILLAIDNGFQTLQWLPQILANQHFIGLSELASKSNITLKILTGSSKPQLVRYYMKN